MEQNADEAGDSEDENTDDAGDSVDENTVDSGSSEDENADEAVHNEDNPEYVWGLDTASIVDELFFGCVEQNYGEPAAFGRYLETKEGVSYGITAEEVSFFKERDIKIIPIYNHFTDATGYEKGVSEAETAIQYAQENEVPEGIYIFADIEPTYPVDSSFLLGWYETIMDSPYLVGFYGIFSEGEPLTIAYEDLLTNIKDSSEIAIWHSSEPYVGITTKENAPSFRPEVPDFVNVTIWQYGIDGDTCNIDTNLLRSDILDKLW
ncbi:glycoside hydrolase domain-containing protein [Cytobacillus sp. FJAT-54145]|uniref:Glycoside hydrolase domain-containing protein n=1 Tax=Cytobacillus spartinae TaxID=3299023 RepID=A0ABW6KDM4_9BACI